MRWLQCCLVRDSEVLESFTEVLNLRYVGHFTETDDITFHTPDYAHINPFRIRAMDCKAH